MQLSKTEIWRLEFHTDMTRAKSHVIPLAVFARVECDGGRFLGMLYRTELFPAELRRVNQETWPELAHLETLLPPMVDEIDSDGIEALQARYPVYSPMQVVKVKAPVRFCAKLAAHDHVEAAHCALEDLMRKHFEQSLMPIIPQALGKDKSATPPARRVDFAPAREDHHQHQHA